MLPSLRFLSLLILLGTLLPAEAQLSFGGRPFGMSAPKYGLQDPQIMTLPVVDAQALMDEDETNAANGHVGPARFGVVHPTQFSMETHGTWHIGPGGVRIWQLAIECPEAMAIGITFTDYRLPEGARVFIHDGIDPNFRGGYTAASNGGGTSMGVAPLSGSRVIVEYQEPAAVAGQGHLTIGEVVHCYRDPFSQAKAFGDSGSCNINVICPDGDLWRDQIRSVALILAGGGSCTGQLLNNCAEDGHPYFLTANHCVSGSVANWVFVFNWDSPDCTPTTNAPDNQTVSGSTLLTSDPGTDMAFLELSAAPPDTFNVFYSGWDNTGAFPDSTVGIHHPKGDIKKISRDLDPPLQGQFGNPVAECWHIQTWDTGTTEPGSSGSGLWNEDGRLVGQLFGGAANCANSVDDYYGRFDLSWPLLEQWLGTCGGTLDGYDPNGITPPTYDAAVTAIYDIPDQSCGVDSITPYITLKNNGTAVMTSVTLNLVLDAVPLLPQPWAGTLLSGQTMNVPLGTIPVGNGPHTLVVGSSQPNGQVDGNPANDATFDEFLTASPAQTVSVVLTLDEWGSETTWELTTDGGALLDEGGPYQNGTGGVPLIHEYCLGDGCYRIVIHDVAGDGICCDYGDGNLVVLDGDSLLIAESDGQFGDVDSVSFCIVGTNVPELGPLTALRVWPNPSNGSFTIAWPGGVERGTLRLFDMTGRMAMERAINAVQGTITIDPGPLAEGGYTLQLTSPQGRAVTRLFVQR
ncbi:MAG: trypsin-like peptidase domain-containing protein [Flavobacteriales bacterium]|jgi:lysyl endopeptidase|nr:trypsin-like peptidase domain-containing protein [Flavobacteriales bacterium]MBK9075619.1 trypsin-like peptidase domain-containing protein [Flavobacteriales bacterium]MBK9537604.1 trypsin-like peptidase domain-containing protein [Flavobacteriales bacterium]